jgi:acetylornithine/N-succinyldiaminopimelate aminotransferase
MNTLRESFFKHLAQTSQSPPAMQFDRAEGSYLYDAGSEKYLDFISGISVSSMGHNNPAITSAIHRQVDNHLHLMVYGEYVISPQVTLAHAVSSLLPEKLQSVFLTNSGAEATEGAMKLSKRYTGRTDFVSFRNAYHGSTQGALSLCGNEELKNSFRPLLPGVSILDFNNIGQLEQIDERVAAVFVEPIQAEAGIIVPENNFLKLLSDRCRKTKTLLVFDEIQTGMGRTGNMFAFERYGVVPDILLLGKAFGGGMPLGAFISSNEIMSTLTFDPALGHLTTSGGHPVSCAAAQASLEILTSTGIVEEVNQKEKLIQKMLHKTGSLRGKGLFYAVDFVSEEINREIIHRCMESGLLTDWFLFAPHCLRIAPPLTISMEDLERGCRIISESAKEIV